MDLLISLPIAVLAGIAANLLTPRFQTWWAMRSKKHRQKRIAKLQAEIAKLMADSTSTAATVATLPVIAPMTDEDKSARETLHVLFRSHMQDLYTQASELSYSIGCVITKQQGWPSNYAELLSAFRQRQVDAKYSALRSVIPPFGKHPGSLMDLERQFDDFYDSYNCWVTWMEKIIHLVPELKSSREYLRWNKTDELFLQDYRKATAAEGLGWLNQQCRGREPALVRLRQI